MVSAKSRMMSQSCSHWIPCNLTGVKIRADTQSLRLWAPEMSHSPQPGGGPCCQESCSLWKQPVYFTHISRYYFQLLHKGQWDWEPCELGTAQLGFKHWCRHPTDMNDPWQRVKPSFGMAGWKSGGAGNTSIGCWKTACIFILFVDAERSGGRLQDSQEDVGKSGGAKAKGAGALDNWHLRACLAWHVPCQDPCPQPRCPLGAREPLAGAQLSPSQPIHLSSSKSHGRKAFKENS